MQTLTQSWIFEAWVERWRKDLRDGRVRHLVQAVAAAGPDHSTLKLRAQDSRKEPATLRQSQVSSDSCMPTFWMFREPTVGVIVHMRRPSRGWSGD